MKYAVKKCDGLVKMRGIHKMAFADDRWPGDDHEFWVAYDEHGAVAGFASVILLDTRVAYFSRCAVTVKHRGTGLHRQLLDTRIAWAKKEGVRLVVTHVSRFNYASMINLLRKDFHFVARSLVPRGNDDFHVMLKALSGDATKLKAYTAKYIEAMLENP